MAYLFLWYNCNNAQIVSYRLGFVAKSRSATTRKWLCGVYASPPVEYHRVWALSCIIEQARRKAHRCAIVLKLLLNPDNAPIDAHAYHHNYWVPPGEMDYPETEYQKQELLANADT